MSTNERNSVGEAGGGVGSGPGGRTPSQLSRTCHRATAQSTNFIRDLEATTTAMAKSLNHETWAKARPDAEEMLTHTKEHIMTATTTKHINISIRTLRPGEFNNCRTCLIAAVCPTTHPADGPSPCERKSKLPSD